MENQDTTIGEIAADKHAPAIRDEKEKGEGKKYTGSPGRRESAKHMKAKMMVFLLPKTPAPREP